MPKRRGDDCDRIKQKIRRLERKLKQKRQRSRDRYLSDDSELSSTASLCRTPSKYQDTEYRSDNNEDVISDVDQRSPDPNVALTPLEVDLEPDPIPSTSRDINSSELQSVVIIPSNPEDSSNPAVPQPTPLADPTIAVTEGLDSDLLDILGADPSASKKYGMDINNELAVRIQHWTTIGVTKEQRNELKDKYFTPENAKLIDPPELNAEIKAAVSEIIIKRDKAIENKQKMLTLAISSLGEGITLLLSAKEKNTALLKLLMDTMRIICDCQHADTVTRRNFLLNAVKKEVREQLQNSKIDALLFGENLAETIKTAKSINKSGTDLKLPAHKPPTKKFSTIPSRNLNWQNPGPGRRPLGPPRMKEPATTSTHKRRASSSKQSQHPPQRQHYKRR
ncbi:hypothetical protein HF086_011612 [Spodoptera exigua]|uniref:Uncharacterized protein n=1 Tax=Spodoptera exigua TaxID=7107 RepID=A0A922MS98_SPOEX|nr:hypothetical protein HF086_011612 [Spodoptera exigua]